MSRRLKIAYYVTGHGFGHAVRAATVAQALALEHELHVVTPVPRAFLELTITRPFHHRTARLDIGVIQRDGMDMDFPGTVRALDDLAAVEADTVDAESEWLRAARIDRVLVDIPPAACAAAAQARIPSAVITNFTWDDIYREHLASEPGLGTHVARFRAQYANATCLFALPFRTALTACHDVRPFGLVGRRSARPRAELRAELGWHGTRHALLSFGGLGLRDQLTIPWTVPEGWRLVCPAPTPARSPVVDSTSWEALHAQGIGHADLVHAADAVVTKPGYGIVSECIANDTPMVYTDRGQFAEYAPITAGIARYLEAVFIAQQQLRSGDLTVALAQLGTRDRPAEAMAVMDPAEIRGALAAFLLG